jgi:hypothetical protein
MRLDAHSPRQFADALMALLPPGDAWRWPVGGTGDALLLATAEELARVDAAAGVVMDNAVEAHRPKASSWNITEYRRVAKEAIAGVSETIPRRTFAVGGHVGDRVWSHAAPGLDFTVELVSVDHLLQPLHVGSRVGDRLYEGTSRYVMRVYYYRSVVDPLVVWTALNEFKQAHVFLHFIDVTGSGGEVNYGQN